MEKRVIVCRAILIGLILSAMWLLIPADGLQAAGGQPGAWNELPIGMRSQIGHLPCPLSTSEGDWLTFGQFVANLEKTNRTKKSRPRMHWTPGENSDCYVLTITRWNASGGVENQSVIHFQKLTTPRGNTIIGIEAVRSAGVDLIEPAMAELWDDACKSHGGMGWSRSE